MRWCYAITAPDGDGWLDMDAESYCESYLYDLDRDPHEQINLIASNMEEHVKVRENLRSRLIRAMEKAGERRPHISPVVQY